MRRRFALPVLIAAAGVAAGCAYYNGLYNANQLAKEARRAEREGRRSEAQSLWAQTAVKAESVAVRFPESRYRDDALLLQATALRSLASCREALIPLQTALTVSRDARIRSQAGLLLGQCHLTLGRPDSAVAHLDALVEHRDAGIASQARWWRGRAELAAGRPQMARADLARTAETGAVFDRALAEMAVGAWRTAALVLDTARQLPYDERQWGVVLDRLSVGDPRAASELVERLLNDDLTSGQRARLLMDDGRRWTERDPTFSAARFEAAVVAAGDSLEGRSARAHLAVVEARRTDDFEVLGRLVDELGRLMLEGGEISSLVGRFTTHLDDVVSTAAAPGDPHPDLRLFRAAEIARDSMDAPAAAAALFLRVARDFPESVIAPKALLAAAGLRRDVRDSVHTVLRNAYGDSPYTRAAGGPLSADLAAIEDSIRTLMDQWIGRSPP